MRCLTFAAVGLTALFVSLPLSVSYSPSWSLPQLTMSKAEAYVTYRRARVATRRAYRRGAYHSYYAHPDGLGGYPYSAPYYAYRGVYAPPVVVHRGWGGGWNRGGRGWGWGWGHSWGRGFGWGVHRGWRW
jgi:hypothetical protein